MNRPAPRWRRVGGSLIHERTGYVAPCHREALVVDMMPEHVERLPWADATDVAELRAEWAALVKKLPKATEKKQEGSAA